MKKKKKKNKKNTVVYVHFLHKISFFFNEIIPSSYNTHTHTHTHTHSIHLVFDILKSFNVKPMWLNWVTSLSTML
jgi:hypothetical protein